MGDDEAVGVIIGSFMSSLFSLDLRFEVLDLVRVEDSDSFLRKKVKKNYRKVGRRCLNELLIIVQNK